MADRHTLRIADLKDFERWLLQDGWTIVSIYPKENPFEVLRATKDGKKYPLIIYKRMEAKEHLTVQNRDYTVVKAYLKARRKNGR